MPALSVVRVTSVPLDVLHVDVQESVRHLSPGQSRVQLADMDTFQGTRYSKCMIVAYGCTACLPDFAETDQIALFGERVYFIVKPQLSCYDEHYHGFYLEKTGHIPLVEQESLHDVCPLSAYIVAGKLMVKLKRHICLQC